jgi:Flp pilus assembly pilin Flp
MNAMFVRVVPLATDLRGAAAIEYALIASAISIAISIPLIVLGDGLGSTYEVIGLLMDLN